MSFSGPVLRSLLKVFEEKCLKTKNVLVIKFENVAKVLVLIMEKLDINMHYAWRYDGGLNIYWRVEDADWSKQYSL